MRTRTRAEPYRRNRTRGLLAALTAGLVASVLTWAALASAEGNAGPCTGRGTSVVVDLGGSDLWMCKDGTPVKRHRVAIGSGGIGKRRQGDKKTPVGTYRLGKPRASRQFGTFIHVGYPTRAQKKRGYTGSAIGIHGPDRRFTWAGPLNTLFDLTLGCVMVQSDAAIGEIADWVKAERIRVVHLVSDPDPGA